MIGMFAISPKEKRPPPDRDHDGVPDAEDACPDVPAPRAANPKKPGCPAPADRDGDGIPDEEDACPDVPGVASTDPSKNGCPADRDGDGIPDDKDACPDQPGPPNEDPRKNGCPLPKDTDGDGIPDEVDACPLEPGDMDPDPEKNGCPKYIRRVKGSNEIQILKRIEFEFDKSTILPVSYPILDEIYDLVHANPAIKLLSIEGHTDNQGTPDYNQRLSDDRASAVLNYLQKKGLDPSRMTATGYGLTKPIATNDTDEGRQKNRRVEFHISETIGVNPAPPKSPAPAAPAAPSVLPKP